ncbi:MAG TPA: hypothetical protein DCW29_02390 [Janthinobacterium sp.]|nr:hypothetical protein [Janthinobacterium sp.]
MRPFKLLAIGALGFCLAGWARAFPAIYHVNVDTSSLSGSAGALDFNFNPGPLTAQAAMLQIQNFSSDGTPSSAPVISGDVSGGPLPATLTFDNGGGFNDYFNGFAFGTALSFDVTLFGPALQAPDGVATSGSTFAFSLFSDAAGTHPALTSNTAAGFAYTVDVNLDGSTTATSFLLAPVPLPEPGSPALMGAGLAILLLSRRRRSQGAAAPALAWRGR